MSLSRGARASEGAQQAEGTSHTEPETKKKIEEEEEMIHRQKEFKSQIGEEDDSNSSSKPVKNISKLHLNNSVTNGSPEPLNNQVCALTSDEDEPMECIQDNSVAKLSSKSVNRTFGSVDFMPPRNYPKDDLELCLESNSEEEREEEDDDPVVLADQKSLRNSSANQPISRAKKGGFEHFFDPIDDNSDSEIVF